MPIYNGSPRNSRVPPSLLSGNTPRSYISTTAARPQPSVDPSCIFLPPRQFHSTHATPDALATLTTTPLTPSTASLANADPKLFPRRHVTTPPRNADADNARSATTTPPPDVSLPTSRSTIFLPLGSRPRRLSPRRLVDTNFASIHLDYSRRSPRRHFRPPRPFLEHRQLTYLAISTFTIRLRTLLCAYSPSSPPTSQAHGSVFTRGPDQFPHRPSTSTRRRRRQPGTRPPGNPPPHCRKHTVSLDAAAFVSPANLALLKHCATKSNLKSSK
ncbi:hypothetical protein R3P38DRAFT_3207527 [Favolaschia claudopus]|uniref:Uncharacterized protein n=1 Tax=Favolaschia claudopus TaxID=2862362 RepID=A0AAW0ALJ8_9AGAR